MDGRTDEQAAGWIEEEEPGGSGMVLFELRKADISVFIRWKVELLLRFASDCFDHNHVPNTILSNIFSYINCQLYGAQVTHIQQYGASNW